MATGQKIETRGHVVGFKEEVAKAAEASDNSFFTWFDAAKDKDTAFTRGSWDFALHMATEFAPHISHPEDKVVLEIGHGGGRILAAASQAFKHAIGVDIHNNNDKVTKELNARGVENFTLYQSVLL